MNSGANTHLLDFNTALPQESTQNNNISERLNTEQIKTELLNRIEDVLFYLFPNGYVRGNCFYIGSTKGNKGKSLTFHLSGERRGSWFDFAEDVGGDILNLWSEARGYQKSEFNKLLSEINEWLGNPILSRSCITHSKQNFQKNGFYDNLGKPTAKWDYLDQNNKLIAVVYRYDTDNGKEFRVWDVKNKKAQAPNPRPLYNIPGIISAKKVILVEGEKSADSLIIKGFAATTAMFGANAPLDKTDWSPLNEKEVIIWPDNDEAGIEYAEKLSKYLLPIASSVAVLTPHKNKPAKWDAADAVLEKNFSLNHFIGSAKQIDPVLPNYLVDDFLNDTSAMPEDLIAPRLLTPGGLLLIGGAPKVGKSDFLINLLAHLAAGESFLGFVPPRPLRIFYLQAEIDYYYLRERLSKLASHQDILRKCGGNLAITPRVQMILDKNGVEVTYRTIRKRFGDNGPDIICVDPIRNVFDGGENGNGENDNNAMLFFLQNRVEKLRSMFNPNIGIILCHHTKKIKKQELEENPFQAFSGASSLRSFYSSGLILYRPDEEESNKVYIYSELRNGPAIGRKIIEKTSDGWIEINPFFERIAVKEYGRVLDAERNRKSDAIIQILAEEALKGRLYTNNQFAESFENKAGLGCKKTIKERVSILATKGHIKFNRNCKEFAPGATKSIYGVLCVKDMMFRKDEQDTVLIPPTHYKNKTDGVIFPVEDPSIWIVHDEEVMP